MAVPQKIKKTTTNDPAISLLDIYSREIKTGYQKIPAFLCLLQLYSQ